MVSISLKNQIKISRNKKKVLLKLMKYSITKNKNKIK